MADNHQFFRALSFLILLFPVSALSQINNQSSALISDTTLLKKSKHSLFASGGYGSNMIYLGSTISQDQPYAYGALTYGYNNELYLTASAVHLDERNPFTAFYAGTASYSHVFNSWFDISAGLSGYRVANSLADTLFSSFLYGDITSGFDWKILYTKISAGVMFSDGTRAYFQLRNSRFFETSEFTKKKFTFSFDPYFNIIAGPMTKSETTSGTVVILAPPYRKGYYRNHGSSTKITTFYGIMETDFGVPVSFNADRFTIEAEPSYVIPLYDDLDYPGLKGFNFMISIYFRIF